MTSPTSVAPDLIRGPALLPMLLIVALPTPVLAQPDIIVTATRSEQRAGETGQAVTVIDRALIATRQLPALSDLLATTPGVTVSRNGGIGQPTAVRIRGAEGDQTLVLIDGVRVGDPAAVGGGFDFGNLLTTGIERVEVLRGSGSVPWGSQALGGVVNIVTARPGEALTGELRGEYGSRDTVNLSGRLSGAIGPIRASIGGGWFRDNGMSAFRFGTEPDGYRQWAVRGRVEADVTDTLTLDLRATYADSRVAFDGFPPPTFAFADTDAFSTTRQFFGYAGARLTTGALTSRFAFTLADTRRASFASANAAPSGFSGRSERFEYQGDARVVAGLRAVFGIEHETTRAAGASTGVTSGYLQAIVTPLQPLTLTGGVRIDRHRTYGTQATFAANAAWQLTESTVLRASYAEGFKAPTLFQLFSNFGNDTLKPEEATTFDIGIEQSLIAGRLRLGATFFHRDTLNQIDFATVPPRAGRPFGYYLNTARTRAQGVETFLELRPTDALTLNANYSFIDARNRQTGARLPRRPVHSVNANIDWTTPFGLRLGAGVQTVSDSIDSDFRTFRRTSLDGYTIVIVRAALPVGDRLEVFGRVENALDAAYETVSGYGTAGRNAHVGVRVKL